MDIGANSDTITGGEISNQRESRSFKIVDLKPVEVESGEEDEVVIYSQQGELFRLEKTKKGHEDRWKEIGDVDIKILKHKEYGTLRLLMRKRLLVVVNHFLDPRITLKPKEGSELSWVWSDLSKGQPSTGQPYWIRFADSDIADNFNNVFEESQEEMERLLAGEDVANSDERAPDGEFSNQRDQVSSPATIDCHVLFDQCNCRNYSLVANHFSLLTLSYSCRKRRCLQEREKNNSLHHLLTFPALRQRRFPRLLEHQKHQVGLNSIPLPHSTKMELH